MNSRPLRPVLVSCLLGQERDKEKEFGFRDRNPLRTLCIRNMNKQNDLYEINQSNEMQRIRNSRCTMKLSESAE